MEINEAKMNTTVIKRREKNNCTWSQNWNKNFIVLL